MPDNYTPDTPGSDITFTKPDIPDCWTPEGGGGGSGGGGLVHYTEDQGVVTLSVTYNELIAIVNSGANPWLVRQVSDQDVVSHYMYRLIGTYYVSEATTGAVFYCNIPNSDNPYIAFEGEDPDGPLVMTN